MASVAATIKALPASRFALSASFAAIWESPIFLAISFCSSIASPKLTSPNAPSGSLTLN
jgi:hypothetical protein